MCGAHVLELKQCAPVPTLGFAAAKELVTVHGIEAETPCCSVINCSSVLHVLVLGVKDA